jgi:hypothetical protein
VKARPNTTALFTFTPIALNVVLAYFSKDREVERGEEIQEGEAWCPGPQEEGDE